jgi:predicted lipid-binding transport protein (Tim44 family)
MRRLLLALPLLLFLAVFAADAFAQAGSGSSGYSGGGSSGGGGSAGGGGSGGSGSGGDWPDGPLGIVLAAVMGFFFLLAVAGSVLPRLRSAIRGAMAAFLGFFAERRYRRKRDARLARVRAAAAEAAEDDAAFAEETVRAEAKRLFLEAQAAWDARDRDRLAEIVAPELLREWRRRLIDFDRKRWHNRVEVLEDPRVEYVGLSNRAGDEEDRAIVRIEARIRAYTVWRNRGRRVRKRGRERVTLREYWTLAKRDGAWMVASVEQRAEGVHHMDGRIVATPWSDETRLSDEALTELAVADGLPDGFTPADVAVLEFDGDARAEALDLALADPRFSPAVLEAAARRAVEAWAEAVDGEDGPLQAVATPDAVFELLYDGDHTKRTRLVVRGLGVKRIQIAALDAQRDPPTMTIRVSVGGRRYVENRDTAAVVSGSKHAARTFAIRWTLALDGDERTPWRIVAAGPVRA